MIEILQAMQEENYEMFVKALLSIEFHIEDDEQLHRIYQRFMDNDSMTLLNDNFINMIQEDNER